MDKNSIVSAPKCKTLQHIRKYNNNGFNDEVLDPYFWLTDKKNPKVINYLKQENNYTDFMMQDTKDLQNMIFNEIKNRIQETDTTSPWSYDHFYYYYKTIKDHEYGIFCRCLRDLNKPSNFTIDNTTEEIILDENQLADGLEFFHVGDEEISPCHQYLAYTVDTIGDEQYSLFIKDLTNNKTYDFAKIANLSHLSAEVTWSADSKNLIFIELNDNLRPFSVWSLDFEYLLSALDTQKKLDENKLTFEIFTELDERFWVGADISRSKEFIFIELESKLSSEIYYLSATGISKHSVKNLKLVKPRQQDSQYFIEHHKDANSHYFYILINSTKDKPNYELYRINLNTYQFTNHHFLDDTSQWELLIKHNNDIKLEDIDCFANYCILFTRINGINYLNVINNYDFNHLITLDIEQQLHEQVYTLSSAHNEMYSSNYYNFCYESMATPDSIYCLTIPDTKNQITNKDLHIKLIKQDEVLNNFDRNNYISKRLYVKIDKNTHIPISLIYHKDNYKADGSHPLLLYGYGSYGISMDPYFSHARISLLDRGIAFAITHIRGGGDLGEIWHHQGRLSCKTNTFNDFIKSAEYLINHQYTNQKKLVIQGGSAGGLLIGNVINQRPELFHIAIAEVPFVDCLNAMLDPDLPLTITEYEEWGNPTADSSVYQYIKSYAPYENVKKQEYPNLLIINSFEDYRVSYWEAAKWTAKLRANKTDNRALLLKTQMTAGHCGASGRYQALHEVAFNYSFILKYLGYKL